uniref:Uncharacterized protein n=1 Tax=Knipowitschia caucasica TaxID=637954 RepID=A0AAV2J4X2_KNICA
MESPHDPSYSRARERAGIENCLSRVPEYRELVPFCVDPNHPPPRHHPSLSPSPQPTHSQTNGNGYPPPPYPKTPATTRGSCVLFTPLARSTAEREQSPAS